MKLSYAFVLSSLLGGAVAFTPAARLTFTRSGDVSLSMSAVDRRAALRQTLATAAASFVTAGFLPSSPASAKTYDQQWLTEPTDEFLENEAKAADFKRDQLKVKKAFKDLTERLVTVSKTEEELRKDLEELTDLVASSGGLPLGVKKEELYKQIRSKKAKGFWPTSVEYAYQQLKLEIAFQQSPNKDKEMGRF